MPQAQNSKACEHHDHAFAEFERRHRAQRPQLPAVPPDFPGICQCAHLPGCRINCSAVVNKRARIRKVLTSEVSPDAAKIMASTTN